MRPDRLGQQIACLWRQFHVDDHAPVLPIEVLDVLGGTPDSRRKLQLVERRIDIDQHILGDFADGVAVLERGAVREAEAVPPAGPWVALEEDPPLNQGLSTRSRRTWP